MSSQFRNIGRLYNLFLDRPISCFEIIVWENRLKYFRELKIASLRDFIVTIDLYFVELYNHASCIYCKSCRKVCTVDLRVLRLRLQKRHADIISSYYLDGTSRFSLGFKKYIVSRLFLRSIRAIPVSFYHFLLFYSLMNSFLRKYICSKKWELLRYYTLAVHT